MKERMLKLIGETKTRMSSLENLVNALDDEKDLKKIIGGTDPGDGNPPPDY